MKDQSRTATALGMGIGVAVGRTVLGRRLRRIGRAVRPLIRPGESIVVVLRAATGPPLTAFWIMCSGMAATWAGALLLQPDTWGVLAWSCVAVSILVVAAVRLIWRPVGVVVTDRRLLVTRHTPGTQNLRKVVVDVPLAAVSARVSPSGTTVWLTLAGSVPPAVRLIFMAVEQGGGAALSTVLARRRPGATRSGPPGARR